MSRLVQLCSVLTALVMAHSASAGVITTFTNAPSSNSVNWTNAVTATSGVINTDLNFESSPVGTLDSNLYLVSNGVTIMGSNFVNGGGTQVTIVNDPGPTQSNTFGALAGEGVYAQSNYAVKSSTTYGALTISFNDKISAFGLFIIDLFARDTASEAPQLAVYSGANGTGTLLGTAFALLNSNFQPNHLYFIGLSSTENEIGSVVFSDNSGSTSDVIGVDNLRYARIPAAPPIPEPSSVVLMLAACAGGLVFGRRVCR